MWPMRPPVVISCGCRVLGVLLRGHLQGADLPIHFLLHRKKWEPGQAPSAQGPSQCVQSWTGRSPLHSATPHPTPRGEAVSSSLAPAGRTSAFVEAALCASSFSVDIYAGEEKLRGLKAGGAECRAVALTQARPWRPEQHRSESWELTLWTPALCQASSKHLPPTHQLHMRQPSDMCVTVGHMNGI